MEMKKLSARKIGSDLHMKLVMLMVIIAAGIFSVAAEDVVLTFRGEGKDFDDAYRGLKGELQDEVELKEVLIDKKSTVSVIADAMEKNSPKLVILMDNQSIGLYRKYQAGVKDESGIVPSISLMAVIVKSAIKDIKKSIRNFV